MSAHQSLLPLCVVTALSSWLALLDGADCGLMPFRPFQTYLLPKISAAFPEFPVDKGPDALYEAQNVLKIPSLIRVEADEVSYPLHVLIRYEIERALIDGTLQVADVPKVWNQKYSEYLQAEPPTDAQGCLQVWR